MGLTTTIIKQPNIKAKKATIRVIFKFEYPKIFIVHYRFSPELFQGTLFETELIRDKNQEWSLLLGDIYHNSGSSLKNVQIHDRMNQCIDIMENKYITDSFCDICPISIKKYFDLNEIRYIFSELIPQLSYRIRGFYFVPLKTSYSKILYIFKDEDYKKVNTSNKKYVSFRLIQTVKPDVYELYLFNEQKTNIMKHSYASIPDTQTSKWVKELCEKKDECIVECKFNTLFQKWVPIKEGSVVDTLLDVKE